MMSSMKPKIDVIIPAFNEENAVDKVLADIPWDLVREVVVCNNGSTDSTAEVARANGATVQDEPQSPTAQVRQRRLFQEHVP